MIYNIVKMASETDPLLTTKHEESKSLKRSALQSITYGSGSGVTNEVPHEQRIIYSWADLNVFVSEKQRRFAKAESQQKHILKNVSGVAYPGELLAILGSSGAGKTTLLNALTFRTPSNSVVSGLRCANGLPLSRTTLTSQSAYVQQDDLFFNNLTAREHLVFHALVRMDMDIPYKQRIKRVDEVIAELSLTKCENSRIGMHGSGISGGERKRLAFAAEVLTDPPLMFCDEPTSGLDSFMALNVMQVLKSMAKRGKTIICTIHQPSSELYALFDKVVYMAEGTIAFLGTPDEADVFFTSINAPCPHNYNPADYYIQLLAIVPGEEESSRQAVDMICSNYQSSPFGKKIAEVTATPTNIDQSEYWSGVGVETSRYKASSFAQFRAVLWRSWAIIKKEPAIIKVRLWQNILTGLVIGLIYFGQTLSKDGVMNMNGAMFIFLTSMTFQNVFTVVNLFCADYPIFIREHTNGMYRTDIYFICRTLAEVPMFTLMPILFTSICYYMIGLNPDPSKFFTALLIIVLVTYTATGFGYLISCATTSVSMSLAIGPPLILPFLLFGGFLLNIGSIPIYLKWLSYFSWFRFGNEALMINQWADVRAINCTGAVDCPSNGRVVLDIYNFSEDNFMMDIGMLCALVVLFRFLAYLSLLWRSMYRE